MAGQGLTGAGGVIFADVGGRWWIDFPVESEGIMEGGDLRELKEIGIARLALRYARKRFSGLRGFLPWPVRWSVSGQ